MLELLVVDEVLDVPELLVVDEVFLEANGFPPVPVVYFGSFPFFASFANFAASSFFFKASAFALAI